MKSRRQSAALPKRLRPRAEKLLATTRREIAQMPVDDVQHLVHELQVHQIELEMQNEELRRTQLELNAERDRYADLHDFSPAAHLTLDASGEILEANLSAGEMLGLARDSLIRQKFSRFVLKQAQDTFYLFCRQVFSSHSRQSAELDLVNAQGKRLLVQVQAIRDGASPLKRCRFSFTDITGRKQIEENLIASLKQIQDLKTALDEHAIVAITNPQGKITYVNDKFCAISKYAREELLGQDHRIISSKYHSKKFIRGLWTTIQHGKVWKGEIKNKAKDGSFYWVDTTIVPFLDEQGEPYQFVAIRADITERKRAEERIEQLYRARAILGGVDHAIVHISDRQQLLDEICRVTVEKGGFKLAWIGMVSSDGSVQPMAKAGATGYLEGIRVLTRDEPEGCGPVGTAIRENRSVVIEDIERDDRMAPWQDRAREFGLRYVAAFPIRIASKVAGAFQIYAPQADFFVESELELLAQVSDDISYALTVIAGSEARELAEEALRQSEARFKLIFETIPIGIAFRIADPGGSFTRLLNEAHLRICGISRDRHDGPKADLKITHPDDRAVQRRFNDQVNAGDIDHFSMEKRYLHPDGKIVWVDFSYQRATYPDGTIEELTTVMDITGRKQMEESLRRSEHNLSIFFNQAPIGLLWLSASGTILRANQAQLDLIGYAAEEYVGHNFLEFCMNPVHERQFLERLANKETVRNLPMMRRRKDGTIRHVLVDANSFWSDNDLQYSSIFVRDITDRVNLEMEIMQVTEREQRRIAQDLHDGLGQLLAGTAYLAGILRQKLAAKSLPEARQLGRIQEVINEAITQTRSLARGLHPVESEPNGLMAALQALAARTKKLFHVRCLFHCPHPVLIENNAVATHLFRIAQEAITNAIKHGKPARIEISLTETPDRINLAIKDNGAGMPRRPKKPGMGLRIMRYRAGMIGGSLAIQKEADGGTTVVCTVHLSSAGGGCEAAPEGHPD